MKKKKKEGSAVAVVNAATAVRGFITATSLTLLLKDSLQSCQLVEILKCFKRGVSVGSGGRIFLC
jgi:hypothetical protein